MVAATTTTMTMTKNSKKMVQKMMIKTHRSPMKKTVTKRTRTSPWTKQTRPQ